MSFQFAFKTQFESTPIDLSLYRYLILYVIYIMNQNKFIYNLWFWKTVLQINWRSYCIICIRFCALDLFPEMTLADDHKKILCGFKTLMFCMQGFCVHWIRWKYFQTRILSGLASLGKCPYPSDGLKIHGEGLITWEKFIGYEISSYSCLSALAKFFVVIHFNYHFWIKRKRSC